MQILHQSLLLFALNLFDGVLTVYWVHNGFAKEGNQLMAGLIETGYTPFLAVKLVMGALAAFVLWHYGRNLRLARYGLTLALAIYIGLMGVHFVTGLSAFGFISDALISNFANLPRAFFAFIN
jgi:hypothetical protein